ILTFHVIKHESARGELRLARRGSGVRGEAEHRLSSRLPPPLHMTSRLLPSRAEDHMESLSL
ncbi:hypothetical protein J6590_093159, partial [Homalodisca vitripennis]